MKPSVRRELVDYAMNTHTVSLRRACKVVGISDSVYRYKLNIVGKDSPQKSIKFNNKADSCFLKFAFINLSENLSLMKQISTKISLQLWSHELISL